MKKTILYGMLMLFFSSCATSSFYHLPSVEFKDIAYGFKTHYVKVRNIEVAYIDEGSGDNIILFIHGLGSNAKGWIKNIPDLSKQYRVIAVDLPGYGKSDKGYYPFSLTFYATVLTEMMTELGISEAVLTGHSMGGQIALVTALQHPHRVSKLVLISPAGFELFEPGEADWMRNAVTPEFVKETPIRNIDINLKSNFYKTPADAEFMITERIQVRGASDFDLYCYAVSKNVAAMLDEPVFDRLGDIDQSTLVIFGEKDGLIPNPYLHGGYTYDIAQDGIDQLPNANLIMMPDCGHFVQFEKATETNGAIFEFLKKK